MELLYSSSVVGLKIQYLTVRWCSVINERFWHIIRFKFRINIIFVHHFIVVLLYWGPVQDRYLIIRYNDNASEFSDSFSRDSRLKTHTRRHADTHTSYRLVCLPWLDRVWEQWWRVMTGSEGSQASNPSSTPGKRGKRAWVWPWCPLSSFMSLVRPLCLTQVSDHNRMGSICSDNVTRHWQLTDKWLCHALICR